MPCEGSLTGLDDTHLYVGEVGAVLVQHDLHEAPDLPGDEVPVDHPVLARVGPAELGRLVTAGKHTNFINVDMYLLVPQKVPSEGS